MTKQRFFYQLSTGLLLLLSIMSQSAVALSLGEINVRSNFAEPFIADITLPVYTADEMGSIEIHLASAKQHKAMGYDLTKTSKQFQFSVKENDKGALYIEIRTKAAVKELSISLLLEVTSVSGRIIKGYDILLSPKVIPSQHEKHADADAHKLKAETPHTNTRDKETSTPQVDSTPKTATPNHQSHSKVKKLKNGGFEYRSVAYGESLSRIAQRIRPDKSMHMYQVMIALYNENPNAFVDSNINSLQAGSNLKLVNIKQIKEISKSDAFSLIQKYAGLSTTADIKADTEGSTVNTANAVSDDIDNIVTGAIGGAIGNTVDRAINNEINNETPFSQAEAMSDEIILSASISSDAANSVTTQLKKAKTLVDDLDIENKNLRERIAALEIQINQASEEIFSPQVSANSAPAAAPAQQNPIVVNDGSTIPFAQTMQNTSFTSENRTIISLVAVGVLLIGLFFIRKKKSVLG